MTEAVRVLVRIAEKRWGQEAPLFSDLDFDIAPGEAVALLGPSGVGKSTLLRMIAGIDTDYSGRIEVDGRPPARAEIPGFVFQDPRLLPWLSARENIRAVSPATTLPQAEALLADLGLAGQGARLPWELSGGMQRRVALARALATEPGLMLLDEPFVSLDRRLVRELHGVVAGIMARRRPTLILVSHEAEDAARLARRVIRIAGNPARIVGDFALDTDPVDRDALMVRDLADRLSGGETT